MDVFTKNGTPITKENHPGYSLAPAITPLWARIE
jgi:hypothetical protein